MSNDSRIINILEISEVFENDDFDISVVKTDSFSAFVEFVCDDDCNNDLNNVVIGKLIKEIENSNKNDDKSQWKIEKIYNSKEFFDDYKEIIKFKK